MTDDDPPAILAKANLWATELRGRGQVDDATAARLNETLAESFGERLDQQDDPLLVVMLCGPTAVGKSSLINALAGANIARPGLGATTRAAMLYMHRLDDPARLFEYSHSLGRNDQRDTEIVLHDRDELLHKVLVDTPDIDSIRLEHKELTARLVHAADLVLFVTSPEKYKVMRSARWVLQQRQQRAIAFVVNKWDRETLGVQRDRRQELVADFCNVLAGEGFPDAVIFKVSTLAEPARGASVDSIENELPALRSWLETGLNQSAANMIRQRRLRAAWGRLAAAIENAAPQPLSGHPLLGEITNLLAASGATVEQQVGAEASVLEPAGLEDNGWPSTPGLLGMWARTRHRLASTTASLRTGLAMLNFGARTAVPAIQTLSGAVFGARSAAVLSETVGNISREAAAARFALGPVEAAWVAETARLERGLAQVPLEIAADLLTEANRMTFRRVAGIASLYAIEGVIIAVLLVAVGRIGLDFVAGIYAPGSLFMTVVELVAMLLFIGNVAANLFFPPLRQRMRRGAAQRSRSLARRTLERLQTELREHVDAVDRLARDGRALLLLIDHAVMALSLATGEEAARDGADVNRLFGQPARLRLAAETTGPQTAPAGENMEPIRRRPSFD